MHKDNDDDDKYSDNVKELPAHDTKHIPLLAYPFRDNIIFHLSQSDDGANNGTALWLGSQILSAFLTDALTHPYTSKNKNMSCHDSNALDRKNSASSSPVSNQNPCGSRQSRRRSHAIELGSGVGLTALALASEGWSVLATDIPTVVRSILRPNIQRNTRNTTTHDASPSNTTRLLGTVQARALDWTIPPEEWSWNDPESVTRAPTTTTLTDSDPASDDIRTRGEAAARIHEDSDSQGTELLGPPFDLIATADTVYSPDLIVPLLRTIKHLVLLSASPPQSTAKPGSRSESKQKQKREKSYPPVYLALEKRDPVQLASFFLQAREDWGLGAQRVPTPRIRRAMSRMGLSHWKRADWEGVEVWRLYLLNPESESESYCNATSHSE